MIATITMYIYIEFTDETCTVAQFTLDDCKNLPDGIGNINTTMNTVAHHITQEYHKDMQDWKYIEKAEYDKIQKALIDLGSDTIDISIKADAENE